MQCKANVGAGSINALGIDRGDGDLRLRESVENGRPNSQTVFTLQFGRRVMYRRSIILAAISLALVAAIYARQPQAQSKYPVMDKVAQKVIDKYQNSSCDDLKQKKGQPPSPQESQMTQKIVQMMQKDPDMRQEFINRVAPPIANKMFECGMIP
jgi:aconitase B